LLYLTDDELVSLLPKEIKYRVADGDLFLVPLVRVLMQKATVFQVFVLRIGFELVGHQPDLALADVVVPHQCAGHANLSCHATTAHLANPIRSHLREREARHIPSLGNSCCPTPNPGRGSAGRWDPGD